jgi:hypothetical protein
MYREDGKIMKGPNFHEPDLSVILKWGNMPHPSKNRPRKGRRKIGSKKRRARNKRK